MAYLKSLSHKFRIRRLRTIYILYWLLLTYIIAALVFWFITLQQQNEDLSHYKTEMVDVNDAGRAAKLEKIADAKKRKTTQYIGEGITFFLLIVAGATYVFRIINRQLYQSQQQQNFMMAITHELKTPISVTKLNLETLQKRSLNAEQQHKLISTTIQEADRLNALCNNLLLTSQIEAGGYNVVKETVNLAELAEECAHDFKVRYPERKIDTDLNHAISIQGDRMLLKLAVNNLLDNAIKYSRRDDIVLLTMQQVKNITRLNIIDAGPGIADEDKHRIFDKYFRGATRQTKGTGLGLYLTKKIVEEHDGSISVKDNREGGSNFEITFAQQDIKT